MLQKLLWPSLLVVVILAVVVYVRFFFSGERRRAPDELEAVALSTASDDERQLAAAELADWGEDAKPHMRRVLKQTKTAAVKANVIGGLAQIYDYESMEDLLAGLADDSDLVRNRSGAAVERMLGRRMGLRSRVPPDVWAKKIEAVRKEWESLKGTPLLEDFKQRLQAKARAKELKKN